MNNQTPSAIEMASAFLKALASRYQVDPSFMEKIATSVEQVFSEFDESLRIPLLIAIEKTVERRALAERGARELSLAVLDLRSVQREFAQNLAEFRSSVSAVLQGPSSQVPNSSRSRHPKFEN